VTQYVETGLRLDSLRSIFITHLHADQGSTAAAYIVTSVTSVSSHLRSYTVQFTVPAAQGLVGVMWMAPLVVVAVMESGAERSVGRSMCLLPLVVVAVMK